MMLLRKPAILLYPHKTRAENLFVLRTARCAAVAPPPGSASSCKGVLRSPFDPQAKRCAPWTRPKPAAFGYPPNAFRPWTLTMPFRLWTMTRGLAPSTRAGGVPPRLPLSKGVPPSPTLPHPSRMGCAMQP